MSDFDEDDLFLAGLEILDSKRYSSKTAHHCYGCGDEMKVSSILICPECLSEECETFEGLTKE